MQRAHNGEQQQGRGGQVAGKEDGKHAKRHHEHHFAGERIDYIAAERTKQQGGDGIARKHQSDHVLSGSEVLAQVERQQWCKHVKGKKQRKVGCHHLAVVPIPKLVHLIFQSFYLSGAKVRFFGRLSAELTLTNYNGA